jgi:hypothetical protein
MRSILFYNVYLINNWKEITHRLLNAVPHDCIVVNACYDRTKIFSPRAARIFFKKYAKVSNLLITPNIRSNPEVIGFRNMFTSVDLNAYDILTYMHGKGVTKPLNSFISDWSEMMRYFHIDRFDLVRRAFDDGFSLYGVNISQRISEELPYGPNKFSSFHFSGNFVSINLNKLRDKLHEIPIDEDYFGLEGYWGKLCSVNDAFCAHISSQNISNHYNEPYPSFLYRND